MTSYSVSYTVGDGEPVKDAEGNEHVPEHAIPILDGVAVADPAPVIDEDEPEDGDEDEAEKCSMPKADGSPCKNNAGDDGLCGTHRKKQVEPDEDAGVYVDAEVAAEPIEANSKVSDTSDLK